MLATSTTCDFGPEPEAFDHAIGVRPAVGEPEVRERREVEIVAENVLRALELVELHEQAVAAHEDAQRIEAFLLRQSGGRHVGVGQR